MLLLKRHIRQNPRCIHTFDRFAKQFARQHFNDCAASSQSLAEAAVTPSANSDVQIAQSGQPECRCGLPAQGAGWG
jgi:hypothetical protein